MKIKILTIVAFAGIALTSCSSEKKAEDTDSTMVDSTMTDTTSMGMTDTSTVVPMDTTRKDSM